MNHPPLPVLQQLLLCPTIPCSAVLPNNSCCVGGVPTTNSCSSSTYSYHHQQQRVTQVAHAMSMRCNKDGQTPLHMLCKHAGPAPGRYPFCWTTLVIILTTTTTTTTTTTEATTTTPILLLRIIPHAAAGRPCTPPVDLVQHSGSFKFCSSITGSMRRTSIAWPHQQQQQ